MFNTQESSRQPSSGQVEVDADFGVRSLDSETSEWYRFRSTGDAVTEENVSAASAVSALLGLPHPDHDDDDNDSRGSSTPQSPHSRSGSAIIADEATADGFNPPVTGHLGIDDHAAPSTVPASYALSDIEQATHPPLRSESPAVERGRSRIGTPSISRGSSPSSSHSLPTSLISASSISSLSRTVSPAESASDSPLQPQLSHLNRSYVFSRTHWAVEEARRRTEEQGDDLSLVLPTLQIPVDSLLLSDSTRFQGQTAVSGAATHRSRRRKPLRVILCGTNRTVNAFLRSLAADQRVKVYKLKGTGRSRDGIYDVGVIAAEEEDISGTTSTEGGDSEPPRMEESSILEREEPERSRLDLSPAVSAKDNVPLASARSSDVHLLARIHVIGKGQDGNLQKAIKRLEEQHKRLNSLLNPFASSQRDEQGKADMEQLIQMWSSNSQFTENVSSNDPAHWFDVAVLTGDSRHLVGRDRGLVTQLTRMIPTICYPGNLAARLTTHVERPFFNLVSRLPPGKGVLQQSSSQAVSTSRNAGSFSQEGPTPRCIPASAQSESYFAPSKGNPILATDAVDDLVDYLVRLHGKQTSSRERRESARIHAFLEWKATQDDIALDSSLESSGTAPLPTLARASGNADWESNLSRRHAARAERRNSQIAPKGPLAMGLQHQSSAPANFFSDGAWRSKTSVSRSRTRESLLGKALLSPLQQLRAIAFPEKHSSGWAWTAVACVTVAIGWGCWWKLKTAGI